MRKARCFSYAQKETIITVTIEKSSIKASGHAGAAPKGQDLVCAAFTMICHSLIESLPPIRLYTKSIRAAFILSAHCRAGKDIQA